jgi:hypothetical protein
VPKHDSASKNTAQIFGANRSWANTSDRTARTRNGRAKSPSSVDWHIERLDPEKFANATPAQKLAAAESAKKAYYAELAMKSAVARRRGGDAA